ncbi:ATP-binding protein [Pectobacterium aroidearum]|uniref:ATP-binding protein n=1 Tax=Pectobacterium aroidearum TaxID=1201031 RepID=A0ABR5Z7P5_9GAMM|nr:AAA family ATPase [Pectobacterium aroidearum]MBA5197800.1 ATP-binding protein [Pectobacterium aroidearum]MBA5230593.1 ATP-binding protein [Pectobacterium aroidearum]
MDISFENLGFIKKGQVITNDITIIFGPNNVGKTYLSYSIFSILKEYRNMFLNAGYVTQKMAVTLLSEMSYEGSLSSFIKPKNQTVLCEEISNNLPKFFKDTNNVLKGVKVCVNENSNDNKNLISKNFAYSIGLNAGYRLIISKLKDEDKIKFTIKESEIIDEDGNAKPHKKPSTRDTVNRMQLLLQYIVTNEFFEFAEKEPFIITSERTGISLFLKEIDSNRNNIVNTIALESYSEIEDSNKTIKNIIERRVSMFSEPINHNINIIRDSFDTNSRVKITKSDTEDYNKIIKTLNELVGGEYKILSDDILFSAKTSDDSIIDMPISMTSGAGKSLFLMDLYLKRYVSKNSYLIIDEPELNLHPKNQIKMAELLVRLSNYGVKVIITTHSDYILKEINNRIMANSLHEDEILNKLGYGKSDTIASDKVNAFTISQDGFIYSVDKDRFGINANIFDEAILDVDSRMEILVGELMRDNDVD